MIMRASEGCLRMKKRVIIALLVVVVIGAFLAYNLVQFNCSRYYTTETKIYLEAFLGMDCNLDSYR